MLLSSRIERVKVWVVIRIFWPMRPNLKQELFLRYSGIESESSWEITQAMGLSEDPIIKYDLFRHASEERAHSFHFLKMAQNLSSRKLMLPGHDRHFKFETKPLKYFLAYCLLGESSAAYRFGRIVDFHKNSDEVKIVKKIVSDEARHVIGARRLLTTQPITDSEKKGLLRQYKREAFFQGWMRTGRRLTSLIGSSSLFLLYFAIAPLALIPVFSKLSIFPPNKFSRQKPIQLRSLVV